MKRWAVIILQIILCLITQTVIFPQLEIASIVPNLLIIMTVSAAYMYGQMTGLTVGLICGLLTDLINGSLFGLYGMVYMVIGYLLGYAVKIYYKEDFTMPILLVGVSDFLAGFAFYVFDFLLRNRLNLVFYLKRIILPEVAYTMLVSIVFYKLLNDMNVKLQNHTKKEG